MLSNGGHYIIWHQAKQCTVIREIPQISHGFAACLIPQNGWHAMIPVKLWHSIWPWHPSPLSPLSLKRLMQKVDAIAIFKNIQKYGEKKTITQQKTEKKIWKIRPPTKKNDTPPIFLSPRWCHFSDSIIFVGIQWYTGHKQVTNDWSKEKNKMPWDKNFFFCKSTLALNLFFVIHVDIFVDKCT